MKPSKCSPNSRLQTEDDFGENELQTISFHEQNLNLNLTRFYPDSKDCSNNIITEFNASHEYNVADFCESSLASSEQIVSLSISNKNCINYLDKR